MKLTATCGVKQGTLYLSYVTCSPGPLTQNNDESPSRRICTDAH